MSTPSQSTAASTAADPAAPVPTAAVATATDPAWPRPAGAAELAGLRAELDRLDDALHALLLERAKVVARVGASAGKGRVKLRLGRQAAILRRLLSRHAGPYPATALLRLWLELLAGSTAMQGGFAIAVAAGQAQDGDPPLLGCAREQFGPLTRMRVHRSPAQAMADLRAGTATAAVLPLPAQDEAAGSAWWTALLAEAPERLDAAAPGADASGADGRLHVVARLPLWAPRPEGSARPPALVLAAVPPDPSGEDRTLLGLVLPLQASRARLGEALAGAGLPARSLLLRHDPGQPAQVLAELDGFVAPADPRLAVLAARLPQARTVLLGAYAVPLAPPALPADDRGAAP